MNLMDRLSRTDEYVTIGRCKISRLLFAEDLVCWLLLNLASSTHYSFAAAYDIVGMNLSSSETEILNPSKNPLQCFLQVGRVSVKQIEKFKYLGVTFTSDERMG